MDNIGLFGGSFNPIHNGHLGIARAFADEIGLDTVLFLPAGAPYHKGGGTIPASARMDMVQAALAEAGDARFAASDIDMVRQGATYSADTVQIFRQNFPTAQLWWLMGLDSLMQLASWKNWRTFVRQTRIAVAARAGQTLAGVPRELQDWLGSALQDGSLKMLSAPLFDISSTKIRERIALGKNIADDVPPSVARYIAEHQLYRYSRLKLQ